MLRRASGAPDFSLADTPILLLTQETTRPRGDETAQAEMRRIFQQTLATRFHALSRHFPAGRAGFGEYDIDRHNSQRRCAIRRARMINNMIYAVGTTHTVCRPRGRHDWESLCLNLSLGTQADHDDEDRCEDMAFEDIDGFSHDDLYAIAGKGILWHCDGKKWQVIFAQLPTAGNA